MRSFDDALIPVAIALALACDGCPRAQPTSAPSPSASAAAPSSAPTESTAPPTPSASASGSPSAPVGTVRQGCDHKGYVTPAGAKPTMHVVSQGALVNVTFVNEGTAPVCLLTHVESHGAHFDWITASLAGGPGPSRNLIFVDDRDRSARYSVELGPNGRFTETMDLGAWAKRRVNGGRALTPGGWVMTLTYDSSRETTAWSGTLYVTANVVIPVDKASILTTP